jgi:EmrB/QacA subfamily drug resistance transporter
MLRTSVLDPPDLAAAAAMRPRLSLQDKRLTLAAATLGSFVALLDSTVVSIALPAIRGDLGGGLESQQWIVNAYLLMLGSLILIGGSLGDVFGARRLFVLGAAGFGVVSVGCALAPSVGALIAARALQGMFGALLTPASLALIVAAFPQDERGRAIGTWTAYSGIAAVVGPLVGGWLVDALSWRWIFAINLPFILVALTIATRMPVAAASRSRRRPDWLGAGLCAIGLAGPTFGLVREPSLGWAHPLVAGPIVSGVAVFVLFLFWERRGAGDPMLPLGLFRRPNFTWGNVETVLIYGGLGLLFFVLVVFLQQTAGYTALEAGAATIPTTVVLFLLAKRFGALADVHGPRLFMAAGPLVSASGVIYLLAMVDEAPAFLRDVLPGTTIFALGLAIVVAPLTAAILADADDRTAGIASGVNNAMARIGGLLATAAVGTVAGGALDLGGFRMALAVVAGLLALGGAIGIRGIRNPRRDVAASRCAGGPLAGAPAALADAPGVPWLVERQSRGQPGPAARRAIDGEPAAERGRPVA